MTPPGQVDVAEADRRVDKAKRVRIIRTLRTMVKQLANSISVSEARQDFAEVVNRVAYGKERVTVERRGRDLVAIVPMSDVLLLEAIEDQLDLTSARAALADAGGAAPIPWTDLRARLSSR